MKNYFKVMLRRSELGSTRCRREENETDSPGWCAEIKERVDRVQCVPPMRINWEQFIFFDDKREEDIERAWNEALAKANGDTRRIHVSRHPRTRGPWSLLNNVGEPYLAPMELAS